MNTLPDFKKGIDYWTAVDATVDGVLGGFGEGVSLGWFLLVTLRSPISCFTCTVCSHFLE